MNSIPEFRVWDGKSMRTDFLLQPDGELCQWDYQESMPLGNLMGLITMFFTGLRDKTGTKIFDNDIVRFVYFDDGKENNKRSRIYYDRRLATYVVDVAYKRKSDYGTWIHGRHKTPVHMIDLKSIEVLGNIYENPEILG